MKGKNRNQATPENDDEVDELDEEGNDENSEDEESQETVPPQKVKAGPKSKQDKERTKNSQADQGGTARPTKLGLIPYIDVPAVKTAKKPTVEFVKAPEVIPRGKPAYRNRAPIDKDEDKYQSIMDKLDELKIEISQGDLMRISNPIRKGWVKHLTPKRVAVPEEARAVAMQQPSQSDNRTMEAVLDVSDLPGAQFMVTEVEEDGMPAGSIVLSDPVEQFLSNLSPTDEIPKIVVASAQESHSLKALYPLINKQGKEESLIDGGSQIVSMAKSVAQELGITWDPSVVIHMQSANKQIEPTEGLAKNVPFEFNEITVYLQVHIIRNAAYKVLLGRPWEVLTQSKVENFSDGSQFVTLTDPVTGEKSMMRSHDRGQPPTILKRPQGEIPFHNSMN